MGDFDDLDDMPSVVKSIPKSDDAQGRIRLAFYQMHARIEAGRKETEAHRKETDEMASDLKELRTAVMGSRDGKEKGLLETTRSVGVSIKFLIGLVSLISVIVGIYVAVKKEASTPAPAPSAQDIAREVVRMQQQK